MSDYVSYSEDCDVRIVAIGHTGDGKSSTCCSIVMDEEAFETSSGMASETEECEHKKACVLGRNVLVVDTPGLFDTRKNLSQTLSELGRCLLLSAPGPHVFIYVVQVGPRFSKEYKDTLAKFRELFGDECTKFMIVVFCGIDNFQYDRKIKSLEEYIGTAPPEVRDLIQDCCNRYVGFNNRCDKMSDENKRQVRRLFTEVDRIKELSRSTFNDRNYYTTEMLKEAERIMKEKDEKFKKEMEEKRKQDEIRLRESIENEARQSMEKERARMQREMERERQKMNEEYRKLITEAQTPARQSALESELVQELKQLKEKRQKTNEENVQAVKREMELQLQLKLKDQQLEHQRELERLRERSREVVQKVDVAPPPAPAPLPVKAPAPAPSPPKGFFDNFTGGIKTVGQGIQKTATGVLDILFSPFR